MLGNLDWLLLNMGFCHLHLGTQLSCNKHVALSFLLPIAACIPLLQADAYAAMQVSDLLTASAAARRLNHTRFVVSLRLKQVAQHMEPPLNTVLGGCGRQLNAGSLLCFKAYFVSSYMLDIPANNLRASAIQAGLIINTTRIQIQSMAVGGVQRAGRTFDNVTSTWVCHFSADAATACSVFLTCMHQVHTDRSLMLCMFILPLSNPDLSSDLV